MTTAAALGLRIAYRVHDSAQTEMAAAGYLGFLNDGIEDLAAAGWLTPVNSATIAQATGTFVYNVPASFVYIQEVRKEGATAGVYDSVLPDWAWSVFLNSAGTPQIRVDSHWVTPATGKNFMVTGQVRVAALATGETVPSGMLGFLRERGTSYAAAYLAGGVSEYANQRRALADFSFRASELMLANMPDEFRIAPGSRAVPGR